MSRDRSARRDERTSCRLTLSTAGGDPPRIPIYSRPAFLRRRAMPAKSYRLTADEVVYAIDASLKPRLTVAAPAEVVIDTLDARGGRLRRPRMSKPPPLTIATAFPDQSSDGTDRYRGRRTGRRVDGRDPRHRSGRSRLYPRQTGFWRDTRNGRAAHRSPLSDRRRHAAFRRPASAGQADDRRRRLRSDRRARRGPPSSGATAAISTAI